MKNLVRLIFSLFVLVGLSFCVNNTNKNREAIKSDSTFTNPLYDGADPWVIKNDGKYYSCYSKNNNLFVSESKFMTIRGEGKIVFKGDEAKLYNLWAPELHVIKGKWYIYLAAAPIDGPPFIHQRTRVLEADNPFGPYVDKGIVFTGDDYDSATFRNNIWAIDMNVFEYMSKWYAVWSGWERQVDTDQTQQNTYIAELIKPWKLGKRVLISKPEEEWERGEVFALQEGQEVLTHNKDLFIVYSTRGSWTVHYKLGLLKLIGENPLDPDAWEKHGPVFEGTNTVHGVGHASFVKSPDNSEYWIFYHSKKDTVPGWNRDVRLQRFDFGENGLPAFGKPIDVGVRIERPSGELDVDM